VTSLRALERFAQRARRARDVARCEVCATPIGDEHRHVVEVAVRRLLCACSACALAFAGAEHARFRTIPEEIRGDPSWVLTERDLEVLGVPVGLAFFFRPSSAKRWLAVFPSPAGATEAELDETAWKSFATGQPLVEGIQEDVEALLVHRRRNGRCSCFVVPVDACYALTALLRRGWRGIDGGDDARAALEEFFDRLAKRCELIDASPGRAANENGNDDDDRNDDQDGDGAAS
jgi:hypothetical protein